MGSQVIFDALFTGEPFDSLCNCHDQPPLQGISAFLLLKVVDGCPEVRLTEKAASSRHEDPEGKLWGAIILWE
jgi:hypothetical protein